VTKTAVITGASRGIGQAIAAAMVEAGYRVLGTATTEAGAENISALLGGKGRGYVVDLAVQQSVSNFLEALKQDQETPLILVNNAGITKDNLLMRMSDDEIDAVVQTNLSGSIRLCRGVARGMIRAKTGRIVLISSVVGLLGSAGQVNYAASKAGLVGAARSLARELGSRGITVNVVAPGFVETDMTAELDESRRDEILGAIPLGRYAAADEVAAVVEFLVGSDAGYITGSVIPVDGGLGMGH